jgi:hypothetical protein
MRWLLPLYLLLATPALAWDGQREVDLELFLAVDVSRSMSPEELEIQRQGYAAALTSDEVWGAIRGGLIGEIAITYVEWAGTYAQNVVVDWTIIETREDLRAVADGITINGLPLMTTDAISEMWGIPDLDVYYTECVIGGPGHFMLPVWTWEDFAPSIQRKLVLEISGLTEPTTEPRVQPASAYDCLIGEKISERNRAIFAEP